MAFGHAQTTGTHLFQCIVQGEPLPSVRWTKDSRDIRDDPRFLFDYTEDGVVSMVIRDVNPDDSGHYQCIAENSEGIAVSSSHLVVKGLKDRPLSSPHISMQLMEVDESDGFHKLVTPSPAIGSNETQSLTATSEDRAPKAQDQDTEENTTYTEISNNLLSAYPLISDRASNSKDKFGIESTPAAENKTYSTSPQRPKSSSASSSASYNDSEPLSHYELQTSISEEFSSLQNDSGFFENSMVLNDSIMDTPSRESSTGAPNVHFRPDEGERALSTSPNQSEIQNETETTVPQINLNDLPPQEKENIQIQRDGKLSSRSKSPDNHHHEIVTDGDTQIGTNVDTQMGPNMNTGQRCEQSTAVSQNSEMDDFHNDLKSPLSNTLYEQTPLSKGTNSQQNDPCTSNDNLPLDEDDDEHKSCSFVEPSTAWVDHVESRTESTPNRILHGRQLDGETSVDTDNRYQIFHPERYTFSHSSGVNAPATTDANNDSQISTLPLTSSQNAYIVASENVNGAGDDLLCSQVLKDFDSQEESLEHEDQHVDQSENSGFQLNLDELFRSTPTAANKDRNGPETNGTSNNPTENPQQSISTLQDISRRLSLDQSMSIPFAQIVQQLGTFDSSTIQVLESAEDGDQTTTDTYQISGSDFDRQAFQEDGGTFAISDVIREALEDGSIQLSFTASMQIPQFIQPPSDVTVDASDTIVLTCVVRGYPDPDVTWVKGEGEERSEVKAGDRVTQTREGEVHRLEIRSAGPSDSGQYVCTASNSEGRVIATVTVSVQDFGSSVDEAPPQANIKPTTSSPKQRPNQPKPAATTEHISRSCVADNIANMAAASEENDEENTEDDQGAVGGQLLPRAGHSMSRSSADSRSMRYAKLVGMAAAFSLAALGVKKVFENLQK